MPRPPGVAYNRSDCPYGCGAPLPPDLRWSATRCLGCQRPLYPDGAIRGDQGEELWPPEHVPRPPVTPPPDAEVWFVVGEQDHRERAVIWNELMLKRRGEEGCVEGCLYIAGMLTLGLLGLGWAIWDRLRRILRIDRTD